MKILYVQICEDIKGYAKDMQYAGESSNEELVYLKLKEIKKVVDSALDNIEKDID